MNQRPTPARISSRVFAKLSPLPMTAFAMALLIAGTVNANPVALASKSGTTSAIDRATPAQLQAAQLACDRLASTEMFDSATAAECSLVYEALKARVFGGDFNRLMAWWASQPRATTTVAARSGSVR